MGKNKKLEEDEKMRSQIREMLRVIEDDSLRRLKSFATGLIHIKKRP